MDKKDKWLQVRLTPTEHAQLAELAPEGMSAWVRAMIAKAWGSQTAGDGAQANDIKAN